MLQMRGEYRDISYRDGAVIADSGWKSNSIDKDCGRLFAALLKKQFNAGLDYMVVGGLIDPKGKDPIDPNSDACLRANMGLMFKNHSADLGKNIGPEKNLDSINYQNYWVYGMPITDKDIVYLDANGYNSIDQTIPTNSLQITVTFGKDEPPGSDQYCFREFALVCIDKSDPTKPCPYLVNFVSRNEYIKYADVAFSRKIKLTFPPNS